MHRRILLVTLLAACAVASPAFAEGKPNIVLVFMDNFAWGELGFNGVGIIRGALEITLAEMLSDAGYTTGML
jgi:hypothetical protein